MKCPSMKSTILKINRKSSECLCYYNVIRLKTALKGTYEKGRKLQLPGRSQVCNIPQISKLTIIEVMVSIIVTKENLKILLYVYIDRPRVGVFS